MSIVFHRVGRLAAPLEVELVDAISSAWFWLVQEVPEDGCALIPKNWTVHKWSSPRKFPVWEKERKDEGIEFSDAQKAFILKQGDDGVPVAEICRKAGISQATYFNWRKKYAGCCPTRCAD